MLAATELPKTVAEAPSLEAAFEAYSKTAGARHPMWNGNCTFSKFKRRFGKAWNARQTPTDAAEGLLDSLKALLAGAGIDLDAITSGESAQPDQTQVAPRAVQPDNLMQPPTNKMVWLLRMQALEAGISTTFRCPLFRGQASDLISKVKAAGGDKAAIRRLLEA